MKYLSMGYKPWILTAMHIPSGRRILPSIDQ